MFTRRVLAVVAVVALGGFLAVLEPDDADGPAYSRTLVTSALP